MFKLEPSRQKSSVQKVLVNLSSLSLTILSGRHNFTMFLKNSWVVIYVEHIFRVGKKVAYLEKQSTITRIASDSPTLGRCVMKSRDIFSHGLIGTGRGFSKLAILDLSTLSC